MGSDIFYGSSIRQWHNTRTNLSKVWCGVYQKWNLVSKLAQCIQQHISNRDQWKSVSFHVTAQITFPNQKSRDPHWVEVPRSSWQGSIEPPSPHETYSYSVHQRHNGTTVKQSASKPSLRHTSVSSARLLRDIITTFNVLSYLQWSASPTRKSLKETHEKKRFYRNLVSYKLLHYMKRTAF